MLVESVTVVGDLAVRQREACHIGPGSFTVTGVGTMDGSGGMIQSMSGDGVRLCDTQGISLSNMNLTNTATTDGPAVNCNGLEVHTDRNASASAVYVNSRHACGVDRAVGDIERAGDVGQVDAFLTAAAGRQGGVAQVSLVTASAPLRSMK